ncbi:hypothetical protein FEAC_20630 [Ferrimicrobium acidiphilum DSM 19497]|jgi:hypothetical protein|uniref:Uncharacterized protein n=1 Tax=Ferrimicrobium acidiphilum DSM 19497 TaxID=1121877 RepID=A0A0D8FSV8_9ACTN|nr:hypothetical protein FEAC_20630 [Ferrimicrobium acidiphilum DSM 19497]
MHPETGLVGGSTSAGNSWSIQPRHSQAYHRQADEPFKFELLDWNRLRGDSAPLIALTDFHDADAGDT